MNKKQILASLNNVANRLDMSGLSKEANTITNIMIRIADEFNIETPADERENKRQRIITQALNTEVLKNNLPSWMQHEISGGPMVTAREIADGLLKKLDVHADAYIDLLNKGKTSADVLVDNLLRSMSRWKEELFDVLKMYGIPAAPVFYYLTQGQNQVIAKLNRKIQEYKEYHDSDLFSDNEF